MSDRIEAEILDVFGEEVDAAVDTPLVVIEGPKGDPGKDGHSPVVTATKSGKTTTISVDGVGIATVEDGADGAQGKDGADGSNGKDGVSPTVSTAATTGGTKVTITDAKGSHEFVVKDGAKGADGSNGKDGTNGKDGADGKPGAAGADGITPHIGSNGNWYLGDIDTGVSAGGGTAGAVLYTAQTLTEAQQFQARKNIGALGHNSPQVQGYMTLTPANETLGHGVGLSPSGSGYDYTLDISEVDTQEPTKLTGVKTPTDADTHAAANVEYVKNKVAGATGGAVDEVMSNTSTNAVQNKVIKKYVDDSVGKKLNQTEPVIKDGLTIENIGDIAIRAQPDSLTSATGEDFATLDFSDSSPQGGGNGVVLGGLANFGDAEAVGLENTAVSYAQLVEYTKPLLLTYDNNQVTGASYTEIRKAITRGRQIKLAVANTPDIIASNAKNETDKCVLRFIHTDVGGDAVNITQYTVTAQASGLTVNVKSHEIADGSEVSY